MVMKVWERYMYQSAATKGLRKPAVTASKETARIFDFDFDELLVVRLRSDCFAVLLFSKEEASHLYTFPSLSSIPSDLDRHPCLEIQNALHCQSLYLAKWTVTAKQEVALNVDGSTWSCRKYEVRYALAIL